MTLIDGLVGDGPTGSRTSFLHLATLASLAVAQPVFDLLSQYPQFLVAHHSGPVETGFLVLLLCVFVPAAVAAVEWLLSRTLGGRCQPRAAGIALLVFPPGLLVLKRIGEVPPVLMVGAAAVLAWLGRRAYLRYRTARLYLTLLSPAILVVPILFLTGTSVQQIFAPAETRGPVLAEGATDTPIVMVVFDELPVQSLLDRHGRIDPVRFPGFAELSGQATWYRNATSVSHSTQFSVPAMLTGKRPEGELGMLPTLAGYPNNLFTWLRRSHRLNVFETTTRLCPACRRSAPGQLRKTLSLLWDLAVVYLHLVLPENLAGGLPDVRHGWTLPKPHRWWRDHPVAQFEAFLETLREDGKPGLNFIHLQIPHVPWIYLPSGKRYRSDWNVEAWNRDELLATQAYQRHLLQVGLADRLLGRLIRKLRASRLFDRSLIVVVSDHGVSFRPGASRRQITTANFMDLLAVPLLIKAPGQQQGGVSDRPTRTTDIFPSIAGILGVPAPWPTDGVPVTETAGVEGRDPVSIAAELFQFLGHRTTVCLDGAAIEVSEGGAWSLLDVVVERGGKFSFFGWAADMETLKPADSILLFADGVLVYQGMNRHSRPDVVEYFKTDELERSGFELEFDRELFQGKRQVRGFAVFGGRIYELNYPPSFPWSAEPMPAGERTDFSRFEQRCAAGQGGVRSFLSDRMIGPEELREGGGDSDSMKRLRRLAWDAGPDGRFRFGPSDSLSGKRLDQLQVTERSGLRIELHRADLYESVRLDGDFLPAAVEGWISDTGVEYVAVAVNGMLRAVAPTFEGPEGRRRFQAIVPENAFRDGSNQVRVFAVEEREAGVVLHAPGKE